MTEALIQATEKVLDEHGPEGVTTLRIAVKAGVSIGTLYQCFRDKNEIVAAALERRKKRAAGPPPPPPPRAKGETIEQGITTIVRGLVSAIARNLPDMDGMAKEDREAIHRVELKRMAEATQVLLTRHGATDDPAQAAHVMTLSCSKVLKDAIRHAPESLTDGRLEGALVRLCMDFLRIGS